MPVFQLLLVKKVLRKFESDLIEKIKNEFPEILEAINSSGKIEEETKNKLVEVIETVKRDLSNA